MSGLLHRWRGALALLLLVATPAGATAVDEAPLPLLRPEGRAAPAPSPLPPPRPDRAALQRVERPDGFRAWRADFRRRTRAAGISARVFDRAFAGVGVNRTVLKRDRYQPEFSRPLWDYLDSAVSEARIATGRAKARAHRRLLQEIEAKYGVDHPVLVAIWGLESAYGRILGDIPVIESLATLAHDGRRRAWAEEQLIAALEILAAGDVTPRKMLGSWAGAMGHTQFIPTSYRDHAVDQTGDGRRDIWSDDPADALASTANYLATAGWRTGAPAAIAVALPANFDYALADPAVRRPVRAWRELGIAAKSGAELPSGEATRILAPAGARGAAFLLYPNFDAIRRYNNATSYALAVTLLAQHIDAEAAHRVALADLVWPRSERALSNSEKRELQRRLTALGFDTQGTDGIVGPNTRSAVRAYQKAVGLTPDGYVSAELLERLGDTAGDG